MPRYVIASIRDTILCRKFPRAEFPGSHDSKRANAVHTLGGAAGVHSMFTIFLSFPDQSENWARVLSFPLIHGGREGKRRERGGEMEYREGESYKCKREKEIREGEKKEERKEDKGRGEKGKVRKNWSKGKKAIKDSVRSRLLGKRNEKREMEKGRTGREREGESKGRFERTGVKGRRKY